MRQYFYASLIIRATDCMHGLLTLLLEDNIYVSQGTSNVILPCNLTICNVVPEYKQDKSQINWIVWPLKSTIMVNFQGLKTANRLRGLSAHYICIPRYCLRCHNHERHACLNLHVVFYVSMSPQTYVHSTVVNYLCSLFVQVHQHVQAGLRQEQLSHTFKACFWPVLWL